MTQLWGVPPDDLARSAQRWKLNASCAALPWLALSDQAHLSTENRRVICEAFLLCLSPFATEQNEISMSPENFLALEKIFPWNELPAMGVGWGKSQLQESLSMIAWPQEKPLLCLHEKGISLARYHTHSALLSSLFLTMCSDSGLKLSTKLKASLHAGNVRAAHALAGGRALHELQEEAVSKSLTHRFSVLEGGPGTGKSLTIGAMVCAALEMGLPPSEILLVAPTGKAAARLAELIDKLTTHALQAGDSAWLDLLQHIPAPATLHRAIGFNRSTQWNLNSLPHAPLAARLVVVDETSMVSNELMLLLVKRLGPQAHFVCVGDGCQLPSVEQGIIFEKLLAAARTGPLCDKAGDTHLTVTFRQEGNKGTEISELSHTLRPSATPDKKSERWELLRKHLCEINMLSTKNDFLGMHFVELSSDEEEGESTLNLFLEKWRTIFCQPLFTKLAVNSKNSEKSESNETLVQTLNAWNDIRMLCATHEGKRGREHLISRLRQELQTTQRVELASARFPFLVGEPVLMNRNDAARRLFNGDAGIVHVSCAGERPQALVSFANGSVLRTFPLSALGDDLSSALATTIHRAQGSEFQFVAFVHPGKNSPLATDNLFYTAVTRAKRGCVVIGNDDGVAARAAEQC